MALYLVNYELKSAGQNYDGLIQYFKSHESWAQLLESSFLVKTPLEAPQLLGAMREHVDVNDRIVVIKVDGAPWDELGLPVETFQWMLDNF